MGKNIYIRAKNMTDEEEKIGDFRGWHTAGDVFLRAADVGDPEKKEEDESGYSYYAGPYIITAAKMRELMIEADAVERKRFDLDDDEETRVPAFVDLYERLEREGREPTLWFCV